MRVLEISFIPPDKKSGGGLVVYQSIVSLAKNAEIDYIGPEFDRTLFEDKYKNIKVLHNLQMEKVSFLKKWIYFITKKATTSYFNSWMRIKDTIDWKMYDIVHIEFSRYLFVVREAKKKNKKIVIRMHNIEADYGYNIYKFNRTLSNWLRFYSYAENEKMVVRDADGLVFLTDVDILRAKKLYQLDTDKIYKNPACIENNNKLYVVEEKQDKSEKIRILMTGTLSFGPNADGIIRFLTEVWNGNFEFKKNVILTIAGSHPNSLLKDTIRKYNNVELVDTPVDMAPYFQCSDIYIAAVYEGAGMKVKVAEALSYGLQVIATSHACIGYEEVYEGKYRADSTEEFSDALNALGKEKLTEDRRNYIKKCFEEKLSMTSSSIRYKQILEKVYHKDV